MEGKQCCWALQLQEFEFQIWYCKGSHNTNADASSRCFSVTATGVVHGPTRDELLQAQLADPILSHLVTSFQRDSIRPQGGLWKQPRYRRWLQLWPHLVIKDGVLHRYYTKPISQEKTVIPIAPSSLRSSSLQQFHDSPSAGHLGFTKTLTIKGQCLLGWNGS